MICSTRSVTTASADCRGEAAEAFLESQFARGELGYRTALRDGLIIEHRAGGFSPGPYVIRTDVDAL